MYKHILIATDGSEHALRAARHAVALAASSGARLSAVTVTPTWRSIGLSEIARGRFEDEFGERMQKIARDCLDRVAALALEGGVDCDGVHASSDRPYEAILEAVAQRGCDLVVVGAHGRRGLQGALLGSETTKILTHSKVPVLVYRD